MLWVSDGIGDDIQDVSVGQESAEAVRNEYPHFRRGIRNFVREPHPSVEQSHDVIQVLAGRKLTDAALEECFQLRGEQRRRGQRKHFQIVVELEWLGGLKSQFEHSARWQNLGRMHRHDVHLDLAEVKKTDPSFAYRAVGAHTKAALVETALESFPSSVGNHVHNGIHILGETRWRCGGIVEQQRQDACPGKNETMFVNRREGTGDADEIIGRGH